jgi:choice-of-anchor C domain-containing protein
MKKHITSAAMALGAALLAAFPAQAASLITNGSFEYGNTSGSFSNEGAGSTNIFGWTVDTGSVDYISSYWAASDGARSIDIAGSAIGALSQSFTTVAGNAYKVTFDLASNPDLQGARDLLVSINGGTPITFTHPGSTGHDAAGMNWTGQSFTFLATGANTTLTFTTNGTAQTYFGPALDNVAVTGVPEPAAWAMLLGGFALVGGSMRRRRTATAVTFA